MVNRVVALSLVLVALSPAMSDERPTTVGSVPKDVRDELDLAPFYAKHTAVGPFAIVSSPRVSDEALREAAWIVRNMLIHRPDVLKTLHENRIRLVVMAPTEMTTDVPEHSDLVPKKYWDARARGLGPTRKRPAVSCGEENLLNAPDDRYSTENILVHEFAHAVHLMGFAKLDETFDARLRAIFERARRRGLWKDTYAMENHREYWAEAVQSYFDTNRPPDDVHGEVDTREELRAHDPEVFELIDSTFRSPKWRYTRHDVRHPRGDSTE